MSLFTVVSWLREKAGGGVFCREPSINSSFGLPDHCSELQAVVAVIKVAIDVLFRNEAAFKEVCTHFKSRAFQFAGNCKADVLAKEDALTPISSDWQRVVTPLSSYTLALDLCTSVSVNNQNLRGCEIFLVQSET